MGHTTPCNAIRSTLTPNPPPQRQVVLTTVMAPSGKPMDSYDAYEYTAHSHSFEALDAQEIPTARFSYNLSPLQILVEDKRKPLYHLITTVCAIVGGVFTLAGILDAVLYQSVLMFKKNQLGKQG